MIDSDISTWDEFRWERIFRREDERIRRYMSEIPDRIDIPNEEESLARRILRSDSGDMDIELLEDIFSVDEDDLEDDLVISEDFLDREGADIYVQITKLASQWTRIYSHKLDESTKLLGVRAICIYGAVLSKLITFLDAPEDLPALSRAAAKRIAGGINQLINLLGRISRKQPSVHVFTESQISRLQLCREKMLGHIFN